MWLSDVKGQEEQYCLLYETDPEATFRFVNLPSCEEVLRLPSNYHGNAISASLDRCQYGDTYRYAVSVANGDVDDEDNVYHTVAWINADGSLNRFDKVNLGKDVRLAQVNIDSRVLDPICSIPTKTRNTCSSSSVPWRRAPAPRRRSSMS